MSKPSPRLTRADLVQRLASSGYCGTKTHAKAAVDVLFACIKDALNKGYLFAVQEFGQFEVIETAERQGRNPKTGEAKVIPAGRRIKFRPSKHLLRKEQATETQ